MSAGSEIALEIKDALAEASSDTGDGPLTCTLRRAQSYGYTPRDAESADDAPPIYYELTAMQDMRQVRDRAGNLVGRTDTILLVDATGEEPLRSDTIAIGVAPTQVDGDTTFHDIASVEPVAPGGVPLMYEVTLAD